MNAMTRREWMATAVTMAGATVLPRATGAADGQPRFREIAPWALYSFDNGLNGPDVPELSAKAALLKKLGYAGMTDHYTLHRLPQVLEALDKEGLEFASLYWTPKVADALDPKLCDAIELLKGRRARIEIGFLSKQFKPSDPAADAKALDILRRIAEWCGDTGPVISIYPHKGFWTERVEDGVRLAQQVGLKTVGTNLNLVHWKWVPELKPLDALLAEAAPYLKLVSINGLDTKNKNAIVSLADGDFDVAGWLAAVKKAGYNGPIGLQCYSLKGPSEDHLKRSMTKWQEIRKQLGV